MGNEQAVGGTRGFKKIKRWSREENARAEARKFKISEVVKVANEVSRQKSHSSKKLKTISGGSPNCPTKKIVNHHIEFYFSYVEGQKICGGIRVDQEIFKQVQHDAAWGL